MSDLEAIGPALDAILRRLGMPPSADLARLAQAWEDLAGEPWASHSRPVGLQRGELLVEVADGSDASLLSYQTAGLVDRLERGLGARWVEVVRIRVRRRKNGR